MWEVEERSVGVAAKAGAVSAEVVERNTTITPAGAAYVVIANPPAIAG